MTQYAHGFSDTQLGIALVLEPSLFPLFSFGVLPAYNKAARRLIPFGFRPYKLMKAFDYKRQCAYRFEKQNTQRYIL